MVFKMLAICHLEF